LLFVVVLTEIYVIK